ncbi:hypothetical protein B0T22DRAFT_100477 [Podospora appendiculata]|uniref:Uncharacterized protein n=1 Tax=Podospora appendiculata TaxID=314037 RepID=A0AAE1CIG1_9PEZI|nr:hypothetical protein B0T22DRAFT_100477 [Podospora appendiculata]
METSHSRATCQPTMSTRASSRAGPSAGGPHNTNEVFYAKPLVYNPRGSSSELLGTVSSQNIVRAADGHTEKLIKAKKLDSPFPSSDANCSEITNTVSITGTPYIDTARKTMYFISKGNKDGSYRRPRYNNVGEELLIRSRGSREGLYKGTIR